MPVYAKPRRYMFAFMLCFVAIGVLEIAAYWINGRIVMQQQEVARFAQLADRQRTLSLQLVLMVDEYTRATTDPVQAAKRTAIEKVAKEMHRLHAVITGNDAAAGVEVPESRRVEQIIFGDPIFLDQTIRLFLAGIDEIVGRPWSADLAGLPYMADIRAAASGSLSTGLQRLGEAMHEAGKSKVAELEVALVVTTVGVVAVIIVLAAFVMVPMMRRLESQTEELIDLATTDPLTGSLNRRSFMREAETEFDRFRRYRSQFAVIMIDIDRFKTVNDTYGHAAGDSVIRALTRVCIEQTRASDVIGRMGGEEFAVLLPEASVESARIAAEKLRAALEAEAVFHEGKEIRFSASLGVAVSGPDDNEVLKVISRADEALYVAKGAGRNRVEVSMPKPKEVKITPEPVVTGGGA